MELHAHIETYAVDCDGPISRTYVMTMDDAERISEFGDIEFHQRIVGHVVNTYSLYRSGKLTVTSGDDSDYVARLEWSEVTEEGRRSMIATICNQECDLEADSSYRDHRAEEMGY